MAYKLLLTWNIRPGRLREQFQQLRRFVAKISSLKLDVEGAWYTVYGDAPHILLWVVSQEPEDAALETVLASEEWSKAVESLHEFIVDYQQRIVRPKGNFHF